MTTYVSKFEIYTKTVLNMRKIKSRDLSKINFKQNLQMNYNTKYSCKCKITHDIFFQNAHGQSRICSGNFSVFKRFQPLFFQNFHSKTGVFTKLFVLKIDLTQNFIKLKLNFSKI